MDDAGTAPSRRVVTRRRVLVAGLCAVGAATAAAAGAVALVDHGVLPGKSLLDQLDGACDVAAVPFVHGALGPSRSGSFFSRARRRLVGYTVGYPPGYVDGTELALVVMLHGEGADHRSALKGCTPAEAVALRVDGAPLAPMALVTVDGGRGYWHAHRDDDPMGMLVDELIPMLQRTGLGRAPRSIGAMGISMGGYGAILLAELHPDLVGAVAAISPAIWTSYGQAAAVNAGAYDSAAQFDRFDAVTLAPALARTPVRIAAGDADPFLPGVEALRHALGGRATVVLSGGCHTGPFFASQEPPSLAFLASHLAR